MPNDDALLTTAEMREADRRTIAEGTSGFTLMRRAGRAVADAAIAMAEPGAVIGVLCGPGNNGGDGYVAARLLQDRGFDIHLATLGPAPNPESDAGIAARLWLDAGSGKPILDWRALLDTRPALLVDALFGAGLARDLDGEAKTAVEAINATRIPVLAVDVPSGLDGDTGRPRGAAIRATQTVTFARTKPGHWLEPGRTLCGAITLADIGISATTIDAIGPLQWANTPELWRQSLPRPGRMAHKYARGAALVMSGGLSGIGAAQLAAHAALRIGAGLVTLACPEDAVPVHAARGPDALMIRACHTAGHLEARLADPRLKAALIGPAYGTGPETRARITALLASSSALVLDADALTTLAPLDPPIAHAIRTRAGSVVLTPHHGEFTRLFGESLAKIDKLSAAREAARISGATIVFKGPDTVVAHPDGRTSIAANAPVWLATAGAGDVLAGMITGLLAGGMPDFEAASAAVWLHGEAANHAGPWLIADDLIGTLQAVMQPVATG